jgi:hypothetical protein
MPDTAVVSTTLLMARLQAHTHLKRHWQVSKITCICGSFPAAFTRFLCLFHAFSLLSDRGELPAGFGVGNQAPEQESADPGGDAGAAAATGAAVATGTTGATASNTPQTPQTPWYKTRKWIIIQIIGSILGIVILFVFLFPVVAALAQLIVNRTSININTAAIIQPTNGSCVLLIPFMLYIGLTHSV